MPITAPERAVRDALDARGISYQREHGLGKWTVDFFVSDWLVIEVDGSYWHRRRPEVDARKTRELTDMGFTVRRLSEEVIGSDSFSAALDDALTGLDAPGVNPCEPPLTLD